MRRNGLHVTALRNQSTKKRERERPAVHFKMSNLDYSNGGIVTGVTGDTFSPSPSPPPRSNFGEAVVALSSPLPACLFITVSTAHGVKKNTGRPSSFGSERRRYCRTRARGSISVKCDSMGGRWETFIVKCRPEKNSCCCSGVVVATTGSVGCCARHLTVKTSGILLVRKWTRCCFSLMRG